MEKPLSDPADLEFPPEAMRALGAATLDRVIRHLATLDEQPACGDLNAEALCRSLREPAPEQGVELERLLDSLFDEWVPRSFTTAGPGYLAYIPGGGVFPAALADLIADTTNRYTGIWRAAPALVQLEANALDWLRDWMEFPAGARGLFTTGGSMANFNAIVAARERHLGPHLRDGVLYASTQVHHSVVKSAKLAGILADRVRLIPVDERFRLRVDALQRAIEADRSRRLMPFLVVSSAGTTNTGAVDPLDDVADLCRREGLWHHVDGAYGGFFHLCPELRPLLAGLARADSLTLDPHKGLFLPYGTGAVLVRDESALRAAHEAAAGYLPTRPDAEEFYEPSRYGPDLSRSFLGLRVWLTVKLYGAAKLRAAIAEKRAMAVAAAEQLGQVPGIALVAPPQLSLFAFHLAWPGSTRAEQNDATRLLIDRVIARGQIMISGCTIDDRFLARVCVLSFRTRVDRIRIGVEHLAEETAAILGAMR
jgi:aromatic-L-amino-acid decarboxylase